MHTLNTNGQPQPDFPVAVEWINPHDGLRSHTNEFCEINIVISGSGLHVLGRDAWPLAVGDVIVLGRRQAHAYRELENLRLVRIRFRPEQLGSETLDLRALPGYQALFSSVNAGAKRHPVDRPLRLAPKELSVALSYVESLRQELELRKPGFAFIGRALFMQVVGYLSRIYKHPKTPDPGARLRIGKALSLLEGHFDQPIKLDELSRIAHMSKRSFIRAFRAATGGTPIAYLVNLRLARAAAILRRNEETVTSVAFKVGYNDSNYFARSFHSMFGMPPSEYRKRHEQI